MTLTKTILLGIIIWSAMGGFIGGAMIGYWKGIEADGNARANWFLTKLNSHGLAYQHLHNQFCDEMQTLKVPSSLYNNACEQAKP